MQNAKHETELHIAKDEIKHSVHMHCTDSLNGKKKSIFAFYIC